MGATWQPVKGFEGHYQVCRSGKVRNAKTGRVLALRPQHDGYVKVHLHITVDGQAQDSYPRVHRLVAEAFIPNPDGKDEVNHINGRRNDNRAANLEWVTRSENMLAIKQRERDKEKWRQARHAQTLRDR